MIGHLRDSQATDAQAPLVVRVLWVALALDKLAIFVSVQQYTAAVMASGTRPSATARNGQAILFVPPWFLMLDELIVADELSGYTAIVIPLNAVICHASHSFPSHLLVKVGQLPLLGAYNAPEHLQDSLVFALRGISAKRLQCR